jgi:hypothetical protein
VTFLIADEVEGAFDTLDLPIVPGATLSVIYTATEARLLVLPPANPADLNQDGNVNGADLGILLLAWGECPETCCPGDLNFTGDVDGGDLGILLLNWTG